MFHMPIRKSVLILHRNKKVNGSACGLDVRGAGTCRVWGHSTIHLSFMEPPPVYVPSIVLLHAEDPDIQSTALWEKHTQTQ